MRSRKMVLAVAALAVAAASAAVPARAEEPVVWLRVDVNQEGHRDRKVKINLPLSLIEVVIDSVDTSKVLAEIKSDKGIDIAKMWKQIRNMDGDEFITVDSDDAKVRVFKDLETFRVSVQELDHGRGNVEIRIPFPVMDYVFENHDEGFKLSDLVNALKGRLPLTLVEATHDEGSVKVWLEER